MQFDTKRFLAAAAVLTLVCTATSAQAQGRGYYGAASGTLSYWELDGDIDRNFASKDTDDFGWGVHVGYQFTEALGLQVGWVDLGGVDAESPLVKGEYSAAGFQAQATGSHALDDSMRLIASAGIYFWDSEFETTSITTNKVEDSGESLTLGLGFEWDLSTYCAGRLEYQRFFDINENDTNTIVASLVFHDWVD